MHSSPSHLSSISLHSLNIHSSHTGFCGVLRMRWAPSHTCLSIQILFLLSKSQGTVYQGKETRWRTPLPPPHLSAFPSCPSRGNCELPVFPQPTTGCTWSLHAPHPPLNCECMKAPLHSMFLSQNHCSCYLFFQGCFPRCSLGSGVTSI